MFRDLITASEHLKQLLNGPTVRTDRNRQEPAIMNRAGLRLCRGFHSTRWMHKNPYYYYDLVLLQPKYSNTDEAKSFVFDGNTDSTQDTLKRASKVFGELGSREKKRMEALKKSRTIAGVKVPGRPEEPTNCCMSGCVNCVWELYKDEIEEWRAQRNEAKQALLTTHTKDPWPVDFGPEPSDRGSSHMSAAEARAETTDESWESDVDISIRVFVETEKKLRKKRQQKSKEKGEDLDDKSKMTMSQSESTQTQSTA